MFAKWKLEDLEYPKQITDPESRQLPMLWHDNEDGDEVEHPIIDALRNGGTIEAVEVHENWYDDRLNCANVIVAVDGKKYGFSVWWMGFDGVAMLCRAESLNPQAVEAFKQYIIEYSE